MESKAAFLIVLCCLLMHTTMVGSDIFFFHTVSGDGVLVILMSQAIAYLCLDGLLMFTSTDTSL